jgi:hypothetical protein
MRERKRKMERDRTREGRGKGEGTDHNRIHRDGFDVFTHETREL